MGIRGFKCRIENWFSVGLLYFDDQILRFAPRNDIIIVDPCYPPTRAQATTLDRSRGQASRDNVRGWGIIVVVV